MKNLNLKRKEINSKGITLVSLVVTIIILLVLAGITVASLTGNNGLIGKTGEAKNATEKSQEKEELEVAVLRFTDKRGNLDATKIVNGLQKDIKNLKEVTNTDGNFPVKVEYKNGHKYQITKDGDIKISVNAGDTAPSDSNAVYSSGDYTAIIPAGFTVSATESSIENGLVVTDGSENEWVWIPVSSNELNLMYNEELQNGKIKEYSLLGTSAKTTYKSIGITLGNRTLSRTTPGSTSGYREPEVLSSYDTDEKYRKQAGFVEVDGITANSLETMATKLKDDYKDMIDSVRENGGFYIGRYELGKNISENNKPQVKAGPVMNSTNWYNLYKACKSFTTGNVESRMIWGCQWDQVCRFISTLGYNKVSTLDNSKTYGNYTDSEGLAETNRGSLGSPASTGIRNLSWKTNNIFDLAGNCHEWTQEARSDWQRCTRGRCLF